MRTAKSANASLQKCAESAAIYTTLELSRLPQVLLSDRAGPSADEGKCFGGENIWNGRSGHSERQARICGRR